MGKKLGLKIILSLILSILITVAALCVISINFTREYGKSLILSQTTSYVSSMESEFEWQVKRLAEIYELLRITNSSGDFDPNEIDEIFEQKKESDSDFGAILSPAGDIIWQTGNFDKSEFGVSELRKTFDGMVSTKTGLSLMSVHVSADNSVCVLGMRLDSNVWLDELKEETGVEYSVFNSKTRYAPPLWTEAGSVR